MSAMIVPKRNLHKTDASPDAKVVEAVKQWITGNSSIPFSRYYVPAYPGRICRPITVLEQHRVPIYSLAQQRHLDQTDAHPLERKKRKKLVSFAAAIEIRIIAMWLEIL